VGSWSSYCFPNWGSNWRAIGGEEGDERPHKCGAAVVRDRKRWGVGRPVADWLAIRKRYKPRYA